jgi:iron complex outermembrane receptor protein
MLGLRPDTRAASEVYLKKVYLKTCLILVLSLALGLFLNAQSTPGPASLSGTVLDSQGRGIGAALVILTPDGSSNSVEITADATGRFTFSNVQPGAYKMVASANGFQNLTKAVDATQESNPELSLTLDVAAAQSTITVHGEQEGIVVPTSSSGSLTPVSIMDLPQSVQVVNRELLDEQKVFQYADAVTYLPGVQRAYTSIAGAVGNEVAIRGFNLDFNNNYLRDGYKFYGLALSDTADIEEVEVLKGPASALYGTAEAGGIVNVISKKPTDTPFLSLATTGGSYQFLRPEFDISGPMNKHKTFFYRLNGVYQNADSFRQYVNSAEYFIAPYFLWKPNASTSLSFQGEFINVNRVSDYGVGVLGDRPAPVPVSTNYGEPWNNEQDRDRQGGYRFSHTFNPRWTLVNGFQVSRTNARYLEVYNTGPDTNPTQLTRLSDAFYFPTLYRYSQTTLLGTVKTGAVTHHIAIGFEAGWVTQSSEGPGGYAPDVNLLNPVTGSDFTEAGAVAALKNPYFTLDYQSVYHNQSGYTQDQLDLGRYWKAIVGLRLERYFQDSVTQSTNTHQTQTDVPVSPRVGLVYEPANWVSIYGSYVRSFIPSSPGAISESGKQFSPEHDHQWEAGIKIAPGAGRMSGTIAFFDIQKTNVVAPDPNNPIFSVQNGRERSKGAEFEFRGSPVRGLNLLTSYAFIQAQVTQSTEFPVGALLPNAPRNSGAMWATYQAPGGMLQHLGVSAGVVATAAREVDFYNTALLPGYARLDLGAYYDFAKGEHQKIRLSLNIQNALDRSYYLASNGSADQIRPGAPFSALASLRWTLQ